MRYIFILSIVIFLSSCTSYNTPEKIDRGYIKLSNDLDKLMDDVIEEKRRANLEKEFYKFTEKVEEYKKENQDENNEYLDMYIKNSKIKIQYLKDLRD